MTRKRGFAQMIAREPLWSRYCFAVAIALVGITIKLTVDEVFQRSLTPYLPAFAAIMVSAALTGFGGGTVTSIIVTAWALYSQKHRPDLEIVDTSLRCCILFFEGILLSAGFERMRRSAKASEKSALWHRKLLATAGEGIWVIGTNHTIVFANKRIAGMLGYELGEIRGRAWETFFFPQDLPMERIRLQNSTVTGASEIAQFDRRMRRKDGSELWVLACVNSLAEDSGGETGSLAMMTDITERKMAELDLRRSESRFRGLFENVLEGVYQSTPEGRIISANPMLLRMLGLTGDEDLSNIDIGRDFYLDPAHRARNLDMLENNGTFQNVEFQLRRRDGRILHVLENARVVRDEDGRVLYYEGTLIDLTEKRTAEISAQVSPATKVQDLRDLLTVISGHAQLALAALSPEHPARVQVEGILTSQRRAAALTWGLNPQTFLTPSAEASESSSAGLRVV